jgi:hypothetical protein
LSVAVVLASACCASPAQAQTFEAVGIRAQGMGGAFVAVADDATAVYWNPGAMATVGIYSAVAEGGEGSFGRTGVNADGSVRVGASPLGLREQSGTLVALGLPPIGVAYYRLQTTEVFASRADTSAACGARLTTDNVAVNVLQSLTDGVHVGVALRLVRGVAGNGFVAGPDAGSLLAAAGDVPDRSSWAVDVDAGLLVARGRWRAGLAARNLAKPSFDLPERATAVELYAVPVSRQVRAGVAFLPRSGTTLAVDADLTRTATSVGDTRRLAIGAEQAVLPRLTVRGGLRLQTAGDLRPSGAAGASVAVTTSIFVDAQVTRGAHDGDRHWSAGLRIGY